MVEPRRKREFHKAKGRKNVAKRPSPINGTAPISRGSLRDKTKKKTDVLIKENSTLIKIDAVPEENKELDGGLGDVYEYHEHDDHQEVMQIDGNNEEKYCYCQEQRPDDMIACDSPDCQIEWFHFTCAGITGKQPDTWYCKHCKPNQQ